METRHAAAGGCSAEDEERRGWGAAVRSRPARARRYCGNVAQTLRSISSVVKARQDAAVAAGTPKAVYGAKRLKVDGEAVRAGVDEHVLFAAVRDAYAAYEAATAEGPAPIGDGDAALVKDGDALLGSLIFSGLPFHEDLAPPFVEN